jgi:hypothetical protein
MASKAWKAFKAAYKDAPLYWGGTTGAVRCAAHREEGSSKVPASEAWNYNRKCSVCAEQKKGA